MRKARKKRERETKERKEKENIKKGERKAVDTKMERK